MLQFRAIVTGPAGPIFVRPLHISQGENQIPFYKKQVTNERATMIFGLVRLIVVHNKSKCRGAKLLAAAHTFNLFWVRNMPLIK